MNDATENASPRMSFREEAEQRAKAIGKDSEAPFASIVSMSEESCFTAVTTTTTSSTSSLVQNNLRASPPLQQQQPAQHFNNFSQHPLVVSTSEEQPYSPSSSSLPVELAEEARKEWRSFGQGITQALEEKRLLRGPNSTSSGTVVRVISAQQREDLSGCKYTAYIIRVEKHFNESEQKFDQQQQQKQQQQQQQKQKQKQASFMLVEHRYSDFCKLNQILKKFQVKLDALAAFPGKHWAGRMGSWTPSLTWAPEKYNELVSSRITQLDIWLVHVVELYNTDKLPIQVAQAVYEFLYQTEHQLPPCHSSYNNEIVSQNGKSSTIGQKLTWNNPLSFTLGSSIRQATMTVQHMMFRKDSKIIDSNKNSQNLQAMEQTIPLDLLHAAKGLCFMTVFKAGCVVSGRIGTGLVIARLDDNEQSQSSQQASPSSSCSTNSSTQPCWSAPCAVGTLGLGYGALIGGDITHYLIILTTHKAVDDLCSQSTKSIQLGAELDIAVGPIGRGATGQLATGDWTIHQAYSYAHSQGFFAGMSLEGSIVSVRNDVNRKFYGYTQQQTPQEILRRPGPIAAEPLYTALNHALQQPIPSEHDFLRPTQILGGTVKHDHCNKIGNHAHDQSLSSMMRVTRDLQQNHFIQPSAGAHTTSSPNFIPNTHSPNPAAISAPSDNDSGFSCEDDDDYKEWTTNL